MTWGNNLIKRITILAIIVSTLICMMSFLASADDESEGQIGVVYSKLKGTIDYHPLFNSILVRIDTTRGNVQLPQGLEILGALPGEWIDIIMPLLRLPELQKLNIDYSVQIWNLEDHYESVKRSYHSLAEMETFLSDIASNYPDITSLFSIGTSYEGRDIFCLEISDNPGVDEGEPGVFYMGLHHAREWPSMEACLYICENLTSFYGVDTEITDMVENRRIWIVPCVNPDGYHWDHDLGHDWRKNRHYFPWSDTYGVDLNRNYDGSCNGDPWGSWGMVVDGHVSHNPSNSLYCGPWPSSEYEVQAVKNMFLQYEICAAISYHTYSELVLWPWSYETSTTPDNSYLSNVGIEIASRITKQSGSGTYTPQQGVSLYPTSGDLTDWVYGYSHYELGRTTFAYTLELCSSFHPPSSYLQQICEENFDGAFYLLQEADNINDVIPRVLPPEINDMTTDDDGVYQISWTEQNPNANVDYFQLDELEGFSINTDDAESGPDLWDMDGFSLSTQYSHSGSTSFKARNQNNDVSSMTSNYPVPVYTDTTLSFWTWYDIETNYDFAYIEISGDDRYYEVLDTFNDSSGGWIYKEYDLWPFNYDSVYIRFRYTTDSGSLDTGFFVDDVSPIADFSTVTTLSYTITNNYYDITGKPDGNYFYRVAGFNSERGWCDYSTLENITVTFNPITISDVKATPRYRETAGWFNISCFVTSFSGINQVRVNITYPDGTSINQTMTNIAGTDSYYLNNTYILLGAYDYYIWANDTDQNQVISVIHYFFIGVNFVDIDLSNGWNLITIPMENTWMASTLAENITGCEMISWFDAENQTYKTHIVGVPLYDFEINGGYGLFVLVDQNSLFSVYGPPISDVSVPLFVGWNMIGWGHDYNTTASSLSENISGCEMVSWFDAENQTFKTHIVGVPIYDFTIMQGMGLFLYTDEASVWHGEG